MVEGKSPQPSFDALQTIKIRDQTGLHIRLPVLLEVPIRHHIVVLHHPVAAASVATQKLNQGSGYQAAKRTTTSRTSLRHCLCNLRSHPPRTRIASRPAHKLGLGFEATNESTSCSWMRKDSSGGSVARNMRLTLHQIITCCN